MILMLFGSVLANSSLFSDTGEASYKIKASYIFNFLRYTTWENDSGGDIRIAVKGSEGFVKIFKAVEEQRVWDRPIQVLPLAEKAELPEGCHLLVVIGEGQVFDYKALPKGVLSVSDQSDASEKGAMLRFYEEDDRVLFEVNYSLVTSAGIKMSSRLLKVAKIVK